MANIKDPKNVQHYLMTTYAPLINIAIAKLKASGRVPKGVEDEELHHAGIHGLMDAVATYNPQVAANVNAESKNPFGTHASNRISGRILDHLDAMHPVPKFIRQQAKNFAAAKAAPQVQTEPEAPLVDTEKKT